VFVDLRTPDTPAHAEADTADVVATMAPLLRQARDAGVAAIVDAGPMGVGRRADILHAVSEAARFPLVVPTGFSSDEQGADGRHRRHGGGRRVDQAACRCTGGDDQVLAPLLEMQEDGLPKQLLLSQDRGWYDPAQPQGGEPNHFHSLLKSFLPKVRSAGVGEATIEALTRLNPWRVFLR